MTTSSSPAPPARWARLSAATIAAQDDLRLVALVDPKGRRRRRRRAVLRAPWSRRWRSPRRRRRWSSACPRRCSTTPGCCSRPACPPWSAPPASTTTRSSELAAAAAAAGVGLVIVPNFALGAVLLMRFAGRGGAGTTSTPRSSSCTRPASSTRRPGTSLRTARLMAEAPGSALRDAPGDQPSRGLAADHVRIHSVRLPGVVAHQEVLFGGDDELLTLRHDSLSRRSFMSGVLLALRRVTGAQGDCRGSGEPPRLDDAGAAAPEERVMTTAWDHPHRHGDAVRRRPRRRPRAARPSSPITSSTTAPTASSWPARPASRRR